MLTHALGMLSEAADIRHGVAVLNALNGLTDPVRELLSKPQVECPVIHHFGPGVCIREVSMPSGSVAIGHRQKYHHMNILLKGKVLMIENGKTKILTAPAIFVGEPGQKVGYILEDMVWQNIYATDLKTPDEIEAEFIEKDAAWSEQQAKIQHRDADNDDYERVLIEFGISQEVAWAQSTNESDRVTVDSQNTRVSDSAIHGKGLYLTHPIVGGRVICKALIDGRRTQAGRYTNHAKQPNAKMVLLDNGDIDLVAIDDINGCMGGGIGTEITIDYRQALNLRLRGTLCQQ